MEIAGFSKVGVVGAGQMGSGIAQVCAQGGLSVVVVDQDEGQLERARSGVAKSVEKLHSKGKLEHDPGSILGRLTFTTEMAPLSEADLVIEAIVEKESAKKALFEQLGEVCREEVILASNTSSIPITSMALGTRRPDRFIGMHFMNPVPLMKLVEIIPGMATDGHVTARITQLAESLGKSVTTSADYPGFVVNRVLMPMINEAFRALMEGVASAEDIDQGMKLGCNQPMGPLTLADFIGLDTCASILNIMHEGLGDPRYKPCPLLVKYVQAGFLGVKSGRGVYHHQKG